MISPAIAVTIMSFQPRPVLEGFLHVLQRMPFTHNMELNNTVLVLASVCEQELRHRK